jgi:hypothetical protein
LALAEQAPQYLAAERRFHLVALFSIIVLTQRASRPWCWAVFAGRHRRQPGLSGAPSAATFAR